MKTKNTYIVWEGLSQMDGAPLVLLVSGVRYSDNKKTGNMLQTFILRRDLKPTDAIKTGADYSTCGNCPQRPFTRKPGQSVCYVNAGKSVNPVWRPYAAGKLTYLPSYKLIEGRKLRMGAYGDPAMIPFHIWQKLLSHVHSHTGYTSSWQEPFATPLKGICQASCNTLELKAKAESEGWQTFTNLPVNHDAPKNAILCPNAKDDEIKCLTCGLCDGKKQNVFLYDHGLPWKKRSVEKVEVLNGK